MKRLQSLVALMIIAVFFFSGCAVVIQKGRRTDIERIKDLEREVDRLKAARGALEDKLSREIEDEQVSLSMGEKGLTITFLAEVLFDSGKDVLKSNSLPILNKVTQILKAEVPDNDIAIEGHTDNEPIKHSGWKSNWELSVHRALSVLYYLEEEGVDSRKLSAVGYGQYRPVVSNEDAKGRQKNRRVEIIILSNGRSGLETNDLTQEPVDSESLDEEEGYK
ncbi:MAG: OmpA family protein [Candidatus Omnitrophota bacterium]